MLKRRVLSVVLLIMSLFSLFGQQVVLDNGVVRRGIDLTTAHVTSKSYMLLPDTKSFIREKGQEFSLMVNDVLHSGLSNWVDIRSRDTIASNRGKGTVISF